MVFVRTLQAALGGATSTGGLPHLLSQSNQELVQDAEVMVAAGEIRRPPVESADERERSLVFLKSFVLFFPAFDPKTSSGSSFRISGCRGDHGGCGLKPVNTFPKRTMTFFGNPPRL